MKPKRHLRHPLLLTGTIRYGAPLFAGFAILITGLGDTTRAAIFGGAPGTAGAGATPQPGATPVGGTTPTASETARANALQAIMRTSQAVGAAKALQDAARAAATANNAGPNPNNPSQTLPDVPNGLTPGGLQPTPGATPGTSQWQGADLPTQAIANGLTNVTVRQTAQQALLTWQTFNVGRGTKLNFDQSAGGTAASQWIAFNKVTDPSANPTQILGQIQSQGQVYIINPNGIIFGGASQINTGGLTASALPINENLINRGLLNNPDAQFLFSGLAIPAGINGTPAFNPEVPASGRFGDVIVQQGAKLSTSTSSKVGGRIALIGANVTNNGTISSPDGQIILASGLQVGFDAHASSDPSLRGLDVFIGAVTDPASTLSPYAGTTINNGIIEVPRGNATLAGKSVHHTGIIDSTTSVSLNGRIDILANYNAIANRASANAQGALFLSRDTGHIEIGEGSVLRILPEWDSEETTIGTELALRSQIRLQGRTIHFGKNSTLLAPNAIVGIDAGIWSYVGGTAPTSTFAHTGGQVYLDEDALIDVSGSLDVAVPVSQNIITVQLRGAELANSPLQRFGILRGATVSVDIRDAGIYQQEMWAGTPLADLTGFINLIQKGVGQLTVAGGTVSINAGGSVVMQSGSEINVSGGSIAYTGSVVETTRLVSGNRLVDIRDARPDEVYTGIFQSRITVDHPAWGVTETFGNGVIPSASRFEAGYTHGGSGGSLSLTAASMALDGKLTGHTIQGERQRTSAPAASSLKLSFYAQDLSYPATLPNHSPEAPDIVFVNGGTNSETVGSFQLNPDGSARLLPASRRETVSLSSSLMTDNGFGSLTIENNDGNITVPGGVDIIAAPGSAMVFKASNITIDGSITLPGGSLVFNTYGIPLDRVNLLANSPPPATAPQVTPGRGNFTLGSGAKLSTAGQVIDERGGLLPIARTSVNGGQVRIEGYSVDLAQGSIIDVSGGASVSGGGQVKYGDGGNIIISGGREIGFSATLGGSLNLGAELLGYSGAKAGSLSITAPAIQIGGTTSNADVTLIGEDFFNTGGFGTFSLSGIGLGNTSSPALLIAPGTEIRPVVQNLVADLSGPLGLNKVTLAEGLRSTANLSFGGIGATYAGVPLAIGDVVMSSGSSIVTDAKGNVSFNGQTVTLSGSITAAGGTISVTGRDLYPTNTNLPQTTALPTVHLTSEARLSTAGKTLLVPSSQGLRQGQVLAGGNITVSGNIIAETGSLLDASGASGTLDLPPLASSLDRTVVLRAGNAQTVPVVINSNGGRITLDGGEMLFTDATLSARAGGASATGGSLIVSSGRFVPYQAAYTTADANLIVTAQGSTLTGPGLGVGQIVRDGLGNTAEQIGHFSIDRYADGGFDSLALQGNVRFVGDVSIQAPGSLKVGDGGVIYANGNVHLQASHVALGQAFTAPTQTPPASIFERYVNGTTESSAYYLTPTGGTGRLTVDAKLIDIGNLSLQGIGNSFFTANNGDIRGNGTLSAAGNLHLRAGQIFPTTAGEFTIFAYNTQSGPGTVQIEASGTRPLPWSAGGKLSIYASAIEQNGTLRAPIGTINLGWDGTGTAPTDILAGNVTKPVTTGLTLGSGSVTSVSAVDPVTGRALTLPYGTSPDGTSWIDPRGVDITTSGLPTKIINLSASSVTTEAGSVIDIKGGGDLYAYRWVSGNGGTRDVLASSGGFAVIPGYAFDYAPYAPFGTSGHSGDPGYVNGNLKIGDTITLAGGGGLPAGTYTLLPARYALLPGAFLVTPQSGTAAGSASRPDGSSIVSGYLANNLDASRTGVTRITNFEIASSSVVRTRSQYTDLLANKTLAAAAIARDLAAPRLPLDSGHLSFSASTAMQLAGRVESLSGTNGRGSIIDISSPVDILINTTGTGGPSGTLVLSSALLNSFGAETLLIGGRRSVGTDGAAVTTITGNLTLDNAGSALVGRDIILVAKNNLTIADNAEITTTTANITADDLSIGSSSTAGSGNGALIRVSGNSSAILTRSSVTTPNTASLTIGSGVNLTGGSIVLDSTAATHLSDTAGLNSSSVALGSGRISVILENPGFIDPDAGLVLSGQTLASLQASARRFALRSYSSLDIYGTGQLGSSSSESLSLQAGEIRGFNQNGGSVSIVSRNLILENQSNSPSSSTSSTLDGSLNLRADQITLGSNNLTVSNFATVSLRADQRILTSGEGTFHTKGDLRLQSGLITGERASNHTISSDGDLTYARLAGQPASGAAGGLGARLTLRGKTVSVNSAIRLPSGSITLASTSGDVLVGTNSNTLLDASGTSSSFNGSVRHTNGGTISLQASGGSIHVASDATLTVAAPSGGGDAGKIEVSAPDGGFQLQGTLTGTAGTSGGKGSFSLDLGSLSGASLAGLDTVLNNGSFTASRHYRLRNGDILVDGTAIAHDYQAVADNGSITVTGTIDASGETGGSIHLAAHRNLTLAEHAFLNASARKFNNAGKGGSVSLEAGAHRNGVIDYTSLLDLRAGSRIDLSVSANTSDSTRLGKFTGTLHLRAPRTADNGGIRIAGINSDITGASSILVEGYKLYTPDATGTITTTLQNQIRTEAQAYLGFNGTASAAYQSMLAGFSSQRSGLGLSSLDLILAPGAEIFTTGDLVLGSTSSTSTGDWNLETFRFGPLGAAGVLTLRASGDIVFYNALSDGFAAVTPNATNGQSSLWLAKLMAENPLLPANAQSWSYRFTSGADLGSADFAAVLPESSLQPGKGSFLLGKNYGNAATYGSGGTFLTSTAIANRFQVVRTGSGNIDINSGRNVYLLNQFSSIYTAGTVVTDPTSLHAAGDFILPFLLNEEGRQPDETVSTGIGYAQQKYAVQYSMAGGNISIGAAADIARMTRTVSTGTGGTLIADSSRQLPNNWLYRRGYIDPVTGQFGIGGVSSGGSSVTDPSASTTWWVDFSNFFQGIGTLGGGNIILSAGRDVSNMDAVAPTNARMPSGTPDASKLIELGGGDITVIAGRNIDGGVYYVERGEGTLRAASEITTNSTRSPSRGILASLTSPLLFDQKTWLPTTLFLGKGGFDVQAGGDLLIGPVANTFLLPQGIGNKFWYKTYFSTYSPDSYVNVTSLGGDITHRTSVSLPTDSSSTRTTLEAWLFANQLISTSQGAAVYQPWLRLAETIVSPFGTISSLMAPTLRSTAFAGDILLQGNLTLSPAAKGQLELFAGNSIIGLNPNGLVNTLGVQRWSTSSINLSDADPASIPGITTPFAYQQVVGNALSALRSTNTGAGQGFMNDLNGRLTETGSLSGSLQQEQSRHTPGLLHRDDDEPVRIFALDGDIEGLTLFTPKETQVIAGRDIGDIAFYIQNVTAGSNSIVSAGRDLTLYNASTGSRLLANASIASNTSIQLTPLAGDIQISGPGSLQVIAGRNLDLGLGSGNTDGTGTGITSVGNSRNPYLSFEGADLLVTAGIGPAASLGSSTLRLETFINEFVLTPDGFKYLEDIAPGIDFGTLSEEQQASLAIEVFYRVLRDAGRDYNNPESPNFRTYTNGYAAIASLFGEEEDTWQGDILTRGRDIRTRNGGDISILVPGGGLAMADSVIGNPLTPPGIVTEAGGNISIFTDGSVDIGIGRIFTLRGGNAVIWSSNGDIAAGSSSRTISAAPPTRVLVDPQSASVETDLAGLATGGGIGVLATVEGVDPGDVDLIAPTGTIDAGDAGIRVSGNINLAAVAVTNAGNISAGGSSSGAPAAVSAAPVAVSTASNAAAASTSTAPTQSSAPAKEETVAPQIEQETSDITVEVIGYGGTTGGDEEDEEEKRRREAAEAAQEEQQQKENQQENTEQ